MAAATDQKILSIETLLDDFEFIDDWEDRYRYVIELGRDLPPLLEEERTDANKVVGCVSQVWLTSCVDHSTGTATLTYRGDSDALIVKGLIAIAFGIYSGKPAKEIVATDAIPIFKDLGLEDHLTPQRSNGLHAMVGRIRSDAEAVL